MSAILAKVVPLSKAKQARLIDEIGALKAEATRLAAEANALLDVFKDFGDGEYVGNKFSINISSVVRESLDTKIAKGFLTPAEIAKATKSAVVTTAKVKAI